MNRYALLTSMIIAGACTPDPEHLPSPPGGGSIKRVPRASVTNGGDAPFAMTGGDFAFAGTNRGIAATTSGLIAIELTGARAGMIADGFQPWILTSSSGFGAAATSIVVPASDRIGGLNYAFFLPNARPQVGIVELETNGSQGRVLTEAALSAELASPFPSALAASSEGLWVVDAVFGPGSSVRFYPFASLSGSPPTLAEDQLRRYIPRIGDVNTDQIEDFASLGKFALADNGRVGLVSFSFLAPAPQGAAGGVLAFDTTTGTELGRLVLPITATSSTALEFVGAVGATANRVVLLSAHKSPQYVDIGGTAAIYEVVSWSPFRVRDTDPAKLYEQPESAVATTLANPLGLAIRDRAALVVNAPFFAEGSLDVIAVEANAKVNSSVALGSLYSMGNAVPGDPKISADRKTAYIPAEVGLLRVEISD